MEIEKYKITKYGRACLNPANGYYYINGKKLATLVMEDLIGGPVPKGWDVHHEDDNRANDDEKNLKLDDSWITSVTAQ